MNPQASTVDRQSISPLFPSDPSFNRQTPSRTLQLKKTKTSPRERTSLDQSWYLCSKRPNTPPLKTFDGFASVSGDHLSPLEDDASIAPVRGTATDETDLQGLQPAENGNDRGTLSLAEISHPGWYRRTLVIDPADTGRRFTLELDGHLRGATVWINGRCLGRSRDLTPHLLLNGTNTMVIHVPAIRHSVRQPACSVWLVKTNSLHVAPWGTAVSASLPGKDSISLQIATMLHNGHAQGKRGALASRILDPAGNSLAEIVTPFHIFGLDRRSCDQAMTIASSALVSLGTHRVVTTVLLEGRVIDECETTFDLLSAIAGSVPQCSLLTGRGTC